MSAGRKPLRSLPAVLSEGFPLGRVSPAVEYLRRSSIHLRPARSLGMALSERPPCCSGPRPSDLGRLLHLPSRMNTNAYARLVAALPPWLIFATSLAAQTAPSIGTQPANRTVAAGASASFTVSATGSPTPTYKWQASSDGGTAWSDLTAVAPYSGVTDTTLTVSGTTTAMSGIQFRCLATNTAGSAPSNAAILTVYVAPEITTPPSGQNVTAGAIATFTVAASGTPAPGWQWQRAPAGSTTFANLTEGRWLRGRHQRDSDDHHDRRHERRSVQMRRAQCWQLSDEQRRNAHRDHHVRSDRRNQFRRGGDRPDAALSGGRTRQLSGSARGTLYHGNGRRGSLYTTRDERHHGKLPQGELRSARDGYADSHRPPNRRPAPTPSA